MSGKTRTVTDKSVLEAAMRITEKRGLSNLNIQHLAAELGLKAPSLYNHIKGIDEVKAMVAVSAINYMEKLMREAAIGYAREEALFRVACAVRDFAAGHPELYKAVNLFPMLSPGEYRKILGLHMNVLHRILDTYKLGNNARTQFILAFRSGLHGFVLLEAVGAFGDNSSLDESFKKMIKHLIKMLESKGNGKKN